MAASHYKPGPDAGADIATTLDGAILETPSSVRLLQLHKNSGNEGVRANLAVFDISETCPPFTTVSYTWGEGHSEEPIRVNGHDRRVLASLVPLLRMLCSDENKDYDLAAHWFWIDSVCINQADLVERAAQVKLMTSIYRKAQSTLVWLAEGSPDTEGAIDFLHILREKRHELRQAVKKHIKRVPADLEGHPGWGSLERLLQRPWWRRVWTLQEFILPERLRFYCGARSISRVGFRQGMATLELYGGPLDKYLPEQVVVTARNRQRIIAWYQDEHQRDRIPLVSLMAACGDHYASDDQDRVWALHGLARQEDRDMIGPPTYQYPVESLYARLVQDFVDTYGSLDIICYAQVFTRRRHDAQDDEKAPNSGGGGWPSWVPDWRVEIAHPSVVPLMVSQSSCAPLANLRPPKAHPSLLPAAKRKGKKKSGNSGANVEVSYRAGGDDNKIARRRRVWFSKGLTHLTCQGVKLDVVDGLGTSQGDYQVAAETTSPINTGGTTNTAIAAEGGHGDDEARARIRERTLHSVAQSLVLDRKDQFLETVAPARQFVGEFQLLGAACTACAAAAAAAAESEDDMQGGAAGSWVSSASKAGIPTWFAGWWKDNNRRELRIRGFTLEELCCSAAAAGNGDRPGSMGIINPGQRGGEGDGITIRTTSKSFYARFRGTMKAAPRRLLVTAQGRVGVAPRRARKGDMICVLLGCSVPVVLRPYQCCDDGDNNDNLAGDSGTYYEFIGECYVDGFMTGEALGLGTPVEEFVLR